jgi:CheY-like chemotaxis protein
MGGRILVVDDDALLRNSVADVLEDEGYQVDHATDGVDALAKIAATPPDAILLDVLMPRMNGKQLLETLHDDPRTHHIPVLMMTAMQGFDAHRTIALGATDLVEKPFDVDELLNKIALALYRSRAGRDPDLDEVARLAPSLDESSPTPRSRGVVLVVDDDHHVVSAFDQLLAGHGYTTVSMSQVSSDLPRLAKALGPHAILLDLRLPGADGVAALALLRAEPALDLVPILVFSGSYRELDRRRDEIEALGAAWLPKTDAVEQVARFLAEPPASALGRRS